MTAEPADAAVCSADDHDCGCGPSRLRCVAIAAAVVAAFAGFLPIAYGANDDSGHPLVLAPPPGTADPSSAPADPLLAWLSATLASGLAWLYRAVPGWPWYGLALAAGNALGAGLIGHTLWRAKLPTPLRWLLALGAGTILFDILFWWTFTKTMLLLQYAAFLQALAWQVGGRKGRFPYGAVILALGAGYLFRWNFFKSSAAFAAPLVLLARPRDWRPAAIVGAAFACLFAFDQTLRQRLANADEGYRTWIDYQDSRAVFHDMPAGEPNEHTPAALAAVGWTQDDYRFFRSMWALYDQEEFTKAKIDAFLAENGKGRPLAENLAGSGQALWLKRLGEHLHANSGYLLAALIPGGLLAAAWFRQRRTGTDFARQAAGLLAVAGLFAFLLFVRLPDRVGGPTILYLLGVLALFAGGTAWSPRFAAAALALAGVAVWWYVGQTALTLQRYSTVRRNYAEFLAKIPAARRGDVVIPMDPTVGFMPETNHPLREEADFDRGLVVVPVGTKVNSPAYARFLARHGYASGRELLLGAMAGKPVLFFSCHDQDYVRPLWLSYLNRHLARPAGRQVKFETVAESPGAGMALLRLVPDPS